MKDKKQIINSIEQIIKDEHRKYKDVLDWKRLAAVRIYVSLFGYEEDPIKVTTLNITPDQVEDYLKSI